MIGKNTISNKGGAGVQWPSYAKNNPLRYSREVMPWSAEQRSGLRWGVGVMTLRLQILGDNDLKAENWGKGQFYGG